MLLRHRKQSMLRSVGRSLVLAALVAVSSTEALATTAPGDAAAPLPLDVQRQMEATVRRYFEGVDRKDPDMIASCFGESAIIRDICAVGGSTDTDPAPVPSQVLVQRCMDFVAAHPDCRVRFHYGPECGRAWPHWVVAHWYETGTWSGATSMEGGDGLEPNGQPLAVEGQTRFLVEPETLQIKEFVVTRTISEWEQALGWLRQRRVREA